MDLQHTFTVPAPLDRAWSTLLDVEGIAPCFPGAALTSVAGDDFAGTVKVKLGPVSLQYAGKGRFLERDEAAHQVRLEANGTDKRGNGTAGATVVARLEAAGDAETRVVVDTDLKVTGRPAQFGRGVLQDVGSKIIEQFATCLASRMATSPAPGASEEPAGDASDASAASTPAPAASAPAPTPSGPEPAASGAATTPSAPTPTPTQPDATSPPLVSTQQFTEGFRQGFAQGYAQGFSQGASQTSAPAGPQGPAREAPVAELDLGSVVLPTLARRYGPAAGAALLVVALARALVRRRED